MPAKIKPVSRTIMGTPVYAVEVPRDKLIGCGRTHNPSARGELSQYLANLAPLPACFIVECEKRFRRVFRIDSDGMLFPVTLDVIPSKERERLAAAGIAGWTTTKRGTK